VTMVAAPAVTIDPWDPSYGQAFGADEDGQALRTSAARLDLELERPAAQWRPVDPDPRPALPDVVLFADGVRRIDARVWVHGHGPAPIPGLAASYAAGLVRCSGGRAAVAGVLVERGLFSPDGQAGLDTRHGRYPARAAKGPAPEQLSQALQQALSAAEEHLAGQARAETAGQDLLVVDGPLPSAARQAGAVGYIKTHHKSYLPDGPAAVVAELAPGQRTPVFGLGTSWRRTSWYLRLPGPSGAPWAGVVRLECPAELPPEQAAALADLTARLLPPLASAAHKDPRAPQNLVPIGGLERELRRRLGDQQLLYRALRTAAQAARAW
jgi:hypothetical protein